jgi:hypothetical protein
MSFERKNLKKGKEKRGKMQNKKEEKWEVKRYRKTNTK